MFMSYLINWGFNPFLERLPWFIKKSKQFNQSDIASKIAALTLTISVNGPLIQNNFRELQQPRSVTGIHVFYNVSPDIELDVYVLLVTLTRIPDIVRLQWFLPPLPILPCQ